MKHNTLSLLSTKLLAGCLALLGLTACNGKKNIVNNDDPIENNKGTDPREEMGRAVALYGGPNMRFQKIEKMPETPVQQQEEKQ